MAPPDDRLDAGADSARHGIARPGGHDRPPPARGGLFGRMFDLDPNDPGEAAIERLATLMVEQLSGGRENLSLPAGYTYFGQFVDHDMTFDATSLLDTEAPENLRTPRLDLDSLYGAGPVVEPFLYDWDRAIPGAKLLLDDNAGSDTLASRDVPRNRQGRAVIGDPRNDENVIVAQLHLLFIRFHNAVVDDIHRRRPALTSKQLLAEAQQTVRWHYQWVVVHDFLDRIVGAELRNDVLRPAAGGAPERPNLRFFDPGDAPFIPIEFSAAAFRCGHTMVRNGYTLKAGHGSVAVFLPPGERGQDLRGLRPIPRALEIEWERLLPLTPAPPVNKAMLFDVHVSHPLRALPPDGQALARLNLRRARKVGLPSGLDVAAAMRDAGVQPLSREELIPTELAAGAMPERVLEAPPLWYYVLREAQTRHDGRRLGDVGGRIVAEVLVGLLAADRTSYLHAPTPWTPQLPGAGGGFRLSDIARFALGIRADPG